MYFGAPDSAAPWFGSLGYMYHPKADGLVSDWMLDLVSISFHKPTKPGVRRSLLVPEPHSACTAFRHAFCCGRCMTSWA